MVKISVITPSIRPEYLKITQEALSKQTFRDFEWLVEIGFENKHTLNADINKMLRRAKGELIVMLQDCIQPDENGLQRFWDIYQTDKTAFVTAPIGKVKQFGDKPVWDWRINNIFIKPEEWEADWASAPLKAFYDIGGYDEDYDQGWSWDNVGVAHRAKVAGYTFLCDPENKALAIDHDALVEHPFRNTKTKNDERCTATINAAYKGAYKLGYL